MGLLRRFPFSLHSQEDDFREVLLIVIDCYKESASRDAPDALLPGSIGKKFEAGVVKEKG